MGSTDQIVQGRWGGILRKPISMSLFPTSFKIHWYSARHWVGGILYWIKFSPSAVSSLLFLIFPCSNPIDPQEGRAAHLSSFVFSFFFLSIPFLLLHLCQSFGYKRGCFTSFFFARVLFGAIVIACLAWTFYVSRQCNESHDFAFRCSIPFICTSTSTNWSTAQREAISAFCTIWARREGVGLDYFAFAFFYYSLFWTGIYVHR